MNEMLRRAAEMGDIEMLYRSIHNDPCILERIDQQQFVETPLHVAVSHDQILFAMEIMMLKPSFAKKLNLDGFTPLHLALQNRPQTTEMVNRLVRVDSNLVRVRGREGKTPLHCVAEEGNLEFLKMFLSLCPLSIQDVTVNNETALFVAVRNGRPEAFEILVQGLCSARRRGYKISSKILMKCNDDETNNVLHIAALTNQPQVIPFSRGSAWEQPPPDLASYLYKNRIVYLGMSLVPSVTELILAEFLYLQYEDADKPIYLYINSTGTTKGGEKLGYETEAFAIYDVMGYVKPPIFTLCVGNAWGEAALLLAAGAKGNRSALPSSTIMMKQPIARFQGQATDVELARKEVNNVKTELVNLFAKHIGKSSEQIEADIRRPKYFSPSEAVEYGIIDKVIYNERSTEDKGVVSDLKRAQLI